MVDPLTIVQGDALERLRELSAESVQCCVTSPPYWGLRDYSTNGQLGLEATPEEYVLKMVEVFREVRRVLRRDGTLWLNLGDSYAGTPVGTFNGGGFKDSSARSGGRDLSGIESGSRQSKVVDGLKPKDLCGIPWRVAFALQADGWWLRSDIIWAKPNPMPESVTDRPTKSHEYLFLLTKSASYFYDAEAIKEKSDQPFGEPRLTGQHKANANGFTNNGTGNSSLGSNQGATTRNKRSVWSVATAPYPEAHFATYPPDLIKPCILAGTSARGCCARCGAPWERVVESVREHGLSDVAFPKSDGVDSTFRLHRRLKAARDAGEPHDNALGGSKTLGWQPTCKCDVGVEPCVVLDPFAGSGTTSMVALELGRKAVLIELNPKYVELIEQRCYVTPGLALAV